MAHGRTGPDIVMNIRYVSASGVSAVTAHELHRTPDGSSAIDPGRTHLNAVLYGPATQQAALDAMIKGGVKGPAAQAEDPYVQMVISASPDFFRTDGKGPGEWDKKRLESWTDKTMQWLRKTYGDDLAHVSLHLDEDTPHIHVLIVPTYEKAARRPGKPSKGETAEDFAARVKAAEDRPKIRTIGRSSNVIWSQNWVKMTARKSYHDDVASLGLGYGRNFVEEGQPSPENVPTGKWVREQAAKQAEDRARFNADAEALATGRTALAEGQAKLNAGVAALATDRTVLAQDRAALDADAKALATGRTALAEGQAKLDAGVAALATDRTVLAQDRAALDADAKALVTGRIALKEGQMKLAAESSAAAERHAKNYQAATRWAEKITQGRAEIAESRSALLADRTQLEHEKATVAGVSSRLSALLEQVEKALRFVKTFAPRVRRITLDAEASADERAAALVARAEIIQAVPPLRRAVSEYTVALFTRRPAAPSSPEKLRQPVEESGPSIDGP